MSINRKQFVKQTFNGISPETPIKVSILCVALKISRCKLLDLMVDDLWEKKKDLVTTTVSQRPVNIKAQKTLNNLRTT